MRMRLTGLIFFSLYGMPIGATRKRENFQATYLASHKKAAELGGPCGIGRQRSS